MTEQLHLCSICDTPLTETDITTVKKTDFRTVAEMALNDPYTALQGATIAQHPITNDWKYFIGDTPAHDTDDRGVVNWDTIADYHFVHVFRETARAVQINVMNEINKLELSAVYYDTTARKIKALAEYLDLEIDEITESKYDECIFTSIYDDDYLICGEDEADARAEEYIRNNLWTFPPHCIAEHIGIYVSTEAIEKIQEMYADANNVIDAMLDDIDDFVYDMIASGGRGAFLSNTDGEEYRIEDYYLYMM